MSGRRILVIDDQQDVIDDYLRILTGKKTPETETFDKEEAFLFKKYSDSSKKVIPEESYRVSIAFQGKEGVDLARKAVAEGDPYLVAFIDMRMPPGIDGMETLKKIWEIDPRVEGVIVTAYTDRSRNEIVNNIGNPDRLLYLKKPFDQDEIKQLALCLTEKWRLARKGEKRFRTLYEGSPDLLHTIDLKGNLVDCNRAYTRAFGSKKDELIGTSILPFFTNESRPVFEKALNEWLKTHYVRDVELWLKPMAGKPFPVLLSATAIYNENSELIGSNSVYRDITRQKQAEEALKESEEKYRTQFEKAMDAIFVADAETGVLIDCNQAGAELVGRAKSELLGKHQRILHPPEEVEGEFSRSFKEHLKDKEGQPLEAQVITKNGGIRDVSIKANMLELKGRKVLQGAFRDVTEHKRAEEEKRKLEAQLQRAEKMEVVGTLAGGVAHDLNNILGGLVSYPGLLLMDLPEDSPLRGPILTIENSGKKAAAIVHDLLTLARRGVTTTEVSNLNDVVTDYLRSPEYERLKSFHPGVKIETSLETSLLNVLGSPAHLSKTVMNLCSNAAEALPDGGKITISTKNQYIDRPIAGYDDMREGDYVVLSVADNGIGISLQDQQRIFEPFYTKKVMGRSGTGLGMAVVWGTVKDHQGYIELKSTEGKGTTFDLYFPVTRKEAEKEKAATSIQEYMGHGQTILVVDDVQEQREIASMLLTQLGYSIHTLSSGEEAVEYVKTNSTDLLVLDMIMDPGIDGLDTYTKILELHPGIKAVITSGFSETDRVKEAQRLGAGQYVKKPYTLEKIGLAVKTELAK